MSHVNGFDSTAFPALWKLSVWVFSPPTSQKSQNPRLGAGAIDCSITLSAASRSPCSPAGPCCAPGCPSPREEALPGALVQPVSLGNRVLAPLELNLHVLGGLPPPRAAPLNRLDRGREISD